MAKDILIYGRIDEYNSREFFKAVAEAREEDEEGQLIFRLNTGGGEPEYGWGMAAKVSETPSKKLKVDGKAYSWGVYACAYADVNDVECLDVSQFMLHRAGYSEWFESSDYFTDSLKENLSSINKKLEAVIRNRIDVEAFENLKQVKEKGITIKSLFSMDGPRIEVFFNAADAKKIKLVGKVVKLTPTKQTELDTFARIAKGSSKEVDVEQPEEVVLAEEPKNTTMTLEKLKAEFPLVYAAIVAIGMKDGIAEGITSERERVGAWMAFKEIDPAAVQKGISDGVEVTSKVLAEMTAKSLSKGAEKNVESDSPAPTGSNEEPVKQTEKEKVVTSFEAQVNKVLKRKIAA